MAHIPVQPARRGVPSWLWLVLAAVVATAVAFLVFGDRLGLDGGDGVSATETVQPAGPAATPGPSD